LNLVDAILDFGKPLFYIPCSFIHLVHDHQSPLCCYGYGYVLLQVVYMSVVASLASCSSCCGSCAPLGVCVVCPPCLRAGRGIVLRSNASDVGSSCHVRGAKSNSTPHVPLCVASFDAPSLCVACALEGADRLSSLLSPFHPLLVLVNCNGVRTKRDRDCSSRSFRFPLFPP
jgi:hypothetical protein